MIFISHSERERRSASALRRFLMEATNVAGNKIFCTRIHDQNASGEKFSEQLKFELRGCGIVFSILTPDSIMSDWVLFELGAAWALGKKLCLVFMDGVDFRDLPVLLSGFPYVDMDEQNAPIRLMA
ncbi:MAG: toll/interleukin-1 receptor domain-containing protein, partial [Synergistaceae bacterium]|nr:toll/interleukin-1 receptor domain-containing protein [Synergistaceae bacterium]